MRTKRILRVRESSDVFANDAYQKEKQQKLQRRINRRFLSLFVLFLVLIFIIVSQLYQVQIVDHQRYSSIAISQYDETRLELPTRGEIIDRDGQVLVTNQQRLSFIYLAPKTDTNQDKIDKAIRFVENFETDISSMTFRDKQDAYIFHFAEDADKLILASEREQFRTGSLTDNDLYRLKLSRITSSLIEASLSEKQLQEFFIYSKMRGAVGLDVVLKEDVTPEEVNKLLESSQDFLGIEVFINSDRVKTEMHHLGSILGDITTNRQGLLADNTISMQALDYKLNDRVGRSGLEQTYEQVLSGVRTKYSLTYSPSGLVNMSELNPGRKGDTLRLTIDLDYQAAVEEMVINYLQSHSRTLGQEFFNQMYMVVSNPNNGDVLASVGILLDEDGEVHYAPNGTYLSAFLVGSAIKGSVVYLALDQNVFQPGELVMDEPIKIQGTAAKGSFVNLGEIDDLYALARSSNVYMFKTAIALGEGTYEFDKPLNINPKAFSQIRSNFTQFGLGVETGLDVPREETGFKANSTLPGHLLDYVIGQYDSYTAMQLNQYVSTIANGQYRYKMRIASESLNSESNSINYQNDVEILNTIDNADAMQRVQMGFRLCVTDGYCQAYNDLPIEIAAKTGSAEDFFYDEQSNRYSTTTNTLVAYAPYENPQVAVSCITPHHVNNEVDDTNFTNGCEAVVKQFFEFFIQQEQLLPQNDDN